MNSVYLPILFFLLSLQNVFSTTYPGTPSDYLTYLPQLEPGDTLLLEAGIYMDRLNLDDIEGMENLPIVIMGPEGTNGAIFIGNACCNTVSIERCAFLEIRNLTLDGLDIPFIDAIKAEGSSNNWAHHITIENLMVVNHGGAPLTVGINTKCPAWDWVIRKNTFIEPGLGMYLGGSDGTAPFINGIIEYNLILNPLRYGAQIKHQNEGLRNIPGMTLNGKTIIRYNVISKAENTDASTPRPNLLVGNFPASGDGENDYYEIYGNFLWQNPQEGLFQGTGNIAFYNNILVNHHPGGWGIFSFPHNSFAPRNMYLFNNTILTASEGIDLDSPNPAYEQIISGNAIFAPLPLDIAPVADIDNITDDLSNAGNYLVNPTTNLSGIDLTPLPGLLEGSEIDYTAFELFDRNELDFDGYPKGWSFRGAYARVGNALWEPALEIRPEVTDLSVALEPEINQSEFTISVYPNPVVDLMNIDINVKKESQLNLKIFNLLGQEIESIFESNFSNGGTWSFNTKNLMSGIYLLTIQINMVTITKKIIVSN